MQTDTESKKEQLLMGKVDWKLREELRMTKRHLVAVGDWEEQQVWVCGGVSREYDQSKEMKVCKAGSHLSLGRFVVVIVWSLSHV